MATLVHELRTPLNGMLGMTQVMLARDDLPDAVQRQLGLVAASGSHQLMLINDILDFCLLGEKRLEVKPTTTPLRPLIQSIVAAMVPMAEACQVRLSVYVESSVPQAMVVDSTRLRQVLDNLLCNAIKFSAGRTVSLRVEVPSNKSVHDYPPTAVRFSVQDTGVGMSETQLAHVGSLFERGAQDQPGQPGGHGIGLFVTQELLALMGSHLAIASAAGRGTLVSFELRCPSASPVVGL